MTNARDFDWNPTEDDDDSIVVRNQPAIAVFLNAANEVVIRQQDFYDQDHWVYVTKDNVAKVVKKMLELAGIEATPRALAPSKAAERQRRYRERQRNGNRNGECITAKRDGVTLGRDAKSPIAAE